MERAKIPERRFGIQVSMGTESIIEKRGREGEGSNKTRDRAMSERKPGGRNVTAIHKLKRIKETNSMNFQMREIMRAWERRNVTVGNKDETSHPTTQPI